MGSKVEELAILEQEITKCSNCSRLRKVTPIPYPHIYYGTPDELKIFIIGRNVGLEHNYTDVSLAHFMSIYKERWWICKIGKYLRNRLGDDLVKTKMFFCNVCKCSSPNNSQIFLDERDNCKPYLLRQLEIIEPLVILCLGSEAKEFMKSLMTDNIFKDIPVFFLYHPSYFQYQDTNGKSIEQNALLKDVAAAFT